MVKTAGLPHHERETRTRTVEILEDSVFDLKNGITVIRVSNGTRIKEITIDTSSTPSFIKPLYSLLNPVQGAFYLLTSKKFANSLFSAICVSPTSSGKTGIILTYTKHVLDLSDGKGMPVVVYVSPLRALAREKFQEFSRVFGSENVEIKTGDQMDVKLKGKKILISTPDYLSLSIRNKASFIENIQAVIIDEVHTLLNTNQDRSSLDEVLWFVKERSIKFLFLSATVPLVEKMIEFYNPDVFLKSSWQPVSLSKSFLSSVKFRHLLRISPDKCPYSSVNCITECPLVNYDPELYNVNSNEYHRLVTVRIIIDTILREEGKKVLLFVYSKKEGWSILEFLNHVCRFGILNDDDSVPFDVETPEKGKPLTAFYCADLGPEEKARLEREFLKNDRFTVLISTSSLAYGVNLPADVAVIPVWYREFRDRKTGYVFPQFIPDVIDCIQMAGRAGRFGLSERGKVYFLFKGGKVENAVEYLERIESYPYEKVLKARENEPLVANLVLLGVAKSSPVFFIPYFSFYAYCSDISSSEIAEAKYRLIEGNYLSEKDGKLELTEKGNFCLSTGINPLSLERMMRILHDVSRWVADPYHKLVLSFASTITLSGMQAESTFKNFINTYYGETEIEESFIRRAALAIHKRLPEKSTLRTLMEDHGGSGYILQNIADGVYNETNQKSEDTSLISYLLLSTGTYFYLGLPKPYSDLSFIPPSTTNYYVRNLLSFSDYFWIFSPGVVLYFIHAFVHQLTGNALYLFLAMKSLYRENLRFGYFKKGLLSVTLDLLTEQEPKASDFLNIKKTVEEMVKRIDLNKEEFFRTAEEVFRIHVSNRKRFKKKVDIRKLEPDFHDFVSKLDNLFSSVRSGALDRIEEHELYSTRVCELIARNLGQKFKSTDEMKKYVHTYFKVKSLAFKGNII